MTKGEKFILFSAIAMICILNNVFAAINNEPWTDSLNWEKLQKGMTEEKVARVLGEPKQEVRRTSVMWCYQQTPKELNQIPSYGVVVFKKFQDAYALYSWKEPDWELLRAQLEAEELRQAKAEEQARLEEQRIAAEKELERQQLRKQAEQDNIIIKEQTAIRRAETKKYMEELQLKRERERAELRSYKPRSLAARYFLVLGIGFAGGAIVFAIARKRAGS